MELTDQALTQLYDRYGHVLFHRCRGLLRNDEEAWDAVQETFTRVIRSADTFREQSSPLTWMYRISTNYCLNQIRNKRGRQQKHEDHRQEIGGPSVVRPGEDDAADHERLLKLLDGCDEETKACVVHTFFDECTREEVARLVGISVPTVRKRINTFLDRARREFGVALAAGAALFLIHALFPAAGSLGQDGSLRSWDPVTVDEGHPDRTDPLWPRLRRGTHLRADVFTASMSDAPNPATPHPTLAALAEPSAHTLAFPSLRAPRAGSTSRSEP